VFDVDPLPLLHALAEGRLLDASDELGNYKIGITPDGPIAATGLDLKTVQQVFPSP